jgi:protein-disulfide isomerase
MARGPQNPRRGRPGSSVPTSGWRATFQSFGGFWTLGGVIAIIGVLAIMIVAGRPPSTGSGAAFVPRERPQTAGRVAGKPDAPVTIIEYGDYQCPYCRNFWSNTEEQVQKEFVDTGIASIEFRDFIIIGPESQNAAEGAACAQDQGFFWQMHDILFLRQGKENSGTFTTANVKKFAREAAAADPSIKLDGSAFDKCLDSHAHRSAVEQMSAEANTKALHSTPSFVINGQTLTGALTIDQIRTAVNNARGGAR